MIHKFQKGDSVVRRVNHGEGITSWERAGTISGTINKATNNDRPLYSVKNKKGNLHTWHEDQLKHAHEGQNQTHIDFKPGVMT